MPARSWIACTTLKVAVSNISFVINACFHKRSSTGYSKNLHLLHNQRMKSRCRKRCDSPAPLGQRKEGRERRHMVKQYEVEIASCSHDTSKSVGYAEGKINNREFTASWATWEPLGGLFFDSWLDTTPAQNGAIIRALSHVDRCCPTPKR